MLLALALILLLLVLNLVVLDHTRLALVLNQGMPVVLVTSVAVSARGCYGGCAVVAMGRGRLMTVCGVDA
jgi:hypothetical protein